MEYTIPVIDIQSLIQNDISSQKDCLNQISEAIKNQGFFYIINHGLSSEDLQFFLNENKRFFKDIPLEEKKKIASSLFVKGYVAVGVENVDDSQPGSLDIKEAMDICVSVNHPLYNGNQWPDDKYVPNWRKSVELIIQKFSAIGNILLRALSLILGENANYFESFYNETQSSLVRFLRYPPRIEEAPMGCGVHSDYGILTLLLQVQINL